MNFSVSCSIRGIFHQLSFKLQSEISQFFICLFFFFLNVSLVLAAVLIQLKNKSSRPSVYFLFVIYFIETTHTRTDTHNPPQCGLLLLKRYVKPFCSWPIIRPCISPVVSLTFPKERLSQPASRVAAAFPSALLMQQVKPYLTQPRSGPLSAGKRRPP